MYNCLEYSKNKGMEFNLLKKEEDTLEAGVRNKLKGKIVDIAAGDIMSQVAVQVGDSQITSVMTTDSLNDAGFKVGDNVTALTKAINVVLVK